MKKYYQKLVDYFQEKYDLTKDNAVNYTADELNAHPLHLYLVATNRRKDDKLDKLAEETVKTLLPEV